MIETFVERQPKLFIQIYVFQYELEHSIQNTSMIWPILSMLFSVLASSYAYLMHSKNSKEILNIKTNSSLRFSLIKSIGLFCIYFFTFSSRSILFITSFDLILKSMQYISFGFIKMFIIIISIAILVFKMTIGFFVLNGSPGTRMKDVYEFTYKNYSSYHIYIYKLIFYFNKSFYYPTLNTTGKLKGFIKRYFGFILMFFDVGFAAFFLGLLFSLNIVSSKGLKYYGLMILISLVECIFNVFFNVCCANK